MEYKEVVEDIGSREAVRFVTSAKVDHTSVVISSSLAMHPPAVSAQA